LILEKYILPNIENWIKPVVNTVYKKSLQSA
jgi:hypothetical protein